MGDKRDTPVSLFLDANILFSAAHDPDSRSGALITLAKPAAVELVTSAHAKEEALRNLELKRPQALPELSRLLRLTRTVQEAPLLLVWYVTQQYRLPANDPPILAAALHAEADYLVTGDRAHFGHLMDRSIPALSLQVLSLASAFRLLASRALTSR